MSINDDTLHNLVSKIELLAKLVFTDDSLRRQLAIRQTDPFLFLYFKRSSSLSFSISITQVLFNLKEHHEVI